MIRKQSRQEALMDTIEYIKNTDFTEAKALPIAVTLVKKIRPGFAENYEYPTQQLKILIDALKSNSEYLQSFEVLLKKLFSGNDIYEVLIDSGIPVYNGFMTELKARIGNKILPQLKNKGSVIYTLDSLFYEKDDYKWIDAIDDNVWIEFFNLFDIKIDFKNTENTKQLYESLNVISCRIAALSTDVDFRKRINREEQISFLKQNRLINEFKNNISVKEELFKTLYECEIVLHNLKKKSSEEGTSIQEAFTMGRMKKLIDRQRLLIDMIDGEDFDTERFVRNFKSVVQNENTKNSIRNYITSNIRDLAYRISEHEHNTGEHYITADEKEYKNMLKSASKGGFITSFVAVIKNLLSLLSLAPFWQGMAYSVNYAAGFLIIHATHSTLATKQPAMTASTIAGALDKKRSGKPNIAQLAILVSQVWRSQTASFVGNLGIAFPVTLIIAYLWHFLTGTYIADTSGAHQLLYDNNPLKSPCIIYACYTGVFLYLSGIISGYFDNKVIYGKIPERMQEHPLLRRSLSTVFLNRISNYIRRNLGPIMGNICLGFFLGMSGFIGKMFGLNFDIRHITIATANFAIGLQCLEFDVPFSDYYQTAIGIIIIGFLNFFVSFILAFITALFSRNVKFVHYKKFIEYIWQLFKQYPLDFIRPPKTARKPEDFLNKAER